jgi:hypothetical protein
MLQSFTAATRTAKNRRVTSRSTTDNFKIIQHQIAITRSPNNVGWLDITIDNWYGLTMQKNLGLVAANQANLELFAD